MQTVAGHAGELRAGRGVTALALHVPVEGLLHRVGLARGGGARAGGGSRDSVAMLTITEPTGSPAAVSSPIASAVSCTGMSSNRVTRCTAVCGERSTAITPSLWVLIGPERVSPATSPVTLRKRVIRPVGGASTTTAS